MTDQETVLANKLISIVGSSADKVLDAYTWSFVATSLVWLGFGLAVLLVALTIRWRTLKAYAEKDRDEGGFIVCAWILPIVLGLFGSIFIAANLSDLVAPRAAAIHQLFKDVRGHE
jgi:uncharacterized membrane protein